jgi:hypothetical protein
MKTLLMYVFLAFFPPDSGLTPTMTGETTMKGCREMRAASQQFATRAGHKMEFSECFAVNITKAPQA